MTGRGNSRFERLPLARITRRYKDGRVDAGFCSRASANLERRTVNDYSEDDDEGRARLMRVCCATTPHSEPRTPNGYFDHETRTKFFLERKPGR
jgi:hypothetical protein